MILQFKANPRNTTPHFAIVVSTDNEEAFTRRLEHRFGASSESVVLLAWQDLTYKVVTRFQ